MITITLPTPDKRLHAHAKGDRRAKSAATKQWREMAYMLAKQQVKGEPWEAAFISYRFYFPDNIHRDAANAIQSMKPAIDGVVDAGLIAGDNWQRLRIAEVWCGIDRDRPRTELVFSKAHAAT